MRCSVRRGRIYAYRRDQAETLIVVGLSREFLERNFEECSVAAQITNRYGVKNEETTRHKDIYVCRRLRKP